MPTGQSVLERRKQIARRLLELYTITAGLALASGLEKTFASDGPVPMFDRGRMILLGAFLVTLIPFFHGALAWLDDEWLAKLESLTNGRMVIDFVCLFLQLCLLFVLGKSVASPTWFARVYCVLLALDVIWAFLAIWRRWADAKTERAPLGRSLRQEITLIRGGAAGWLWINFAALVTAMCFSAFALPKIPVLTSAAWLATIALGRTLVDYLLNWTFYFPSPPQEEHGSVRST